RGTHRASARQRTIGNSNNRASRLPVSFRGAHPHLKPFGNRAHISDIQASQLATAGHHRKTQQAKSAVPQPSKVVASGLNHGTQLFHRERRSATRLISGLRTLPAIGAQHHAGRFSVERQTKRGVVGLDSAQHPVKGGRSRRRNSVGKRVKIGGGRGSRRGRRPAVLAGAPLLERSPVPPIGSTRVRRPAFGDTRGRSSTQFPAAGDRSGSMGGHERAVSAGSGHRQSFLAMPPKNRFP